MSSNIKPDTVKNFKGISENKWIQGPTFKDGTVLHVEYMGGQKKGSRKKGSSITRTFIFYLPRQHYQTSS